MQETEERPVWAQQAQPGRAQNLLRGRAGELRDAPCGRWRLARGHGGGRLSVLKVRPACQHSLTGREGLPAAAPDHGWVRSRWAGLSAVLSRLRGRRSGPALSLAALLQGHVEAEFSVEGLRTVRAAAR